MKKIILILIVLFLASAAGWYWWSSHQGGAQDGGVGQAGMMGGGAPAVAVYEVKSHSVSLKYELPGRITPYRQSQVRPQVDGIIVERLFEEGANVEKGDQLYQIDDKRYAAALNSALADLESAKANVKKVESLANRYKELVKIDAVSQQEYDDAKAELDQAKAAIAVAEAAVDLAQVNLDYTKVYAPISGRISRSFVTEGTLVTANQQQFLATITQLDPVYVDMQQSGEIAIGLRARMLGKDSIPVTLTLTEKADVQYGETGTLKFSEVTVNETTGSIALRALMPNPDGLLLPGLFVRATLDLGEDEALLVPQRATIRNPKGGLTVWVLNENNEASPRPLQIEQAYEDNWIVTGGVEAGDQIVIEGYQKIQPGMAVTPSPWQQGESQQSQAQSTHAVDNTDHEE
jgi:membrane fusion protein, multidrug efflux system